MDLNVMESSTKQENERLQREKDRLEELLGQSQESLEESRTYINQMQLQQKDEKIERARQALLLSEGIAIERESLVKQLDILKDVNKRLRDDKDEAEATESRLNRQRLTGRRAFSPSQRGMNFASRGQFCPNTSPVTDHPNHRPAPWT